MPVPLLNTILKLVLLALLYLFLAHAVRVVVRDLYGPVRRNRPPPRPAMAPADTGRRRKAPREIVVHPPNGRPRVVALRGDAVTLGRGQEVSVAVEDVYVSDLHAELHPDGEGWVVHDLGSTNGTFLNGAKVTQPTPVSAGDQLRIGKTRVEVRR